MSDQSAQTVPPSDLDAAVDGLLSAPDAGASAAPARPYAASAAPAPAPSSEPAPAGPALASLDEALAEDSMLDQIAGEIDRAAPAPSPQAPQAAPASGAIRDSEFAAPQDLPAPAPAARRGPV
ncbi:MAG TPA: hypothetical protein VHC70_13790, partial [Phycisphaerales bacterium]|nr:hypothetical protein [Phycisphaerales bacterium]